MATRQPGGKRLRLFIALDLPDEVRERIGAWGKRALRDPVLRPVPPENLHITLAFLGWREEDEVPTLTTEMSACVEAAPEIALLDPVGRPSGRRPGLFAFPARSDATVALQLRLADRLSAADLFEPEKRPFWPHVTVARVRRERRGSSRPAVVAKPPKRLPAALSKPFRGVRMTLYRSELQPRGARYVPLAQAELPR